MRQFGIRQFGYPTPSTKGGGMSALQILQSKGVNFFLHDFLGRTDLTFQDAAGNTAADDSGEAVALAFSVDQIGSQTLAQAAAAATELVANGTFDANITGWSAGGNAAISWQSGRLRVTKTDATTFPRATITLSGLTAGRTYRLVGDLFPNGISAKIDLGSSNLVPYSASDRSILAYINATATSQAVEVVFNGGAGVAGNFIEADNISVKWVPGYHASQPGSTSFRPTRQADGSLKGDRLDDNLLQRLTSSTSMFMAAALLGASTPAATAAIIGGPVSTTRGYLARDSAGKLCAGVGADGPSTIVGGSDIAGLKGVAMLNIDASGNVDLEWMPKGGSLASLYSAPINGAVAAGTALRMFATNPSGVAANFGGDSLYLAAAIQTTLTPAERLAIAKDWNARIPS